jgi:hypothetical protein
MRSSMSSMSWLAAASASASEQAGAPPPPPPAARLIRPTRSSLRGARARHSLLRGARRAGAPVGHCPVQDVPLTTYTDNLCGSQQEGRTAGQRSWTASPASTRCQRIEVQPAGKRSRPIQPFDRRTATAGSAVTAGTSDIRACGTAMSRPGGADLDAHALRQLSSCSDAGSRAATWSSTSARIASSRPGARTPLSEACKSAHEWGTRHEGDPQLWRHKFVVGGTPNTLESVAMSVLSDAHAQRRPGGRAVAQRRPSEGAHARSPGCCARAPPPRSPSAPPETRHPGCPAGRRPRPRRPAPPPRRPRPAPRLREGGGGRCGARR